MIWETLKTVDKYMIYASVSLSILMQCGDCEKYEIREKDCSINLSSGRHAVPEVENLYSNWRVANIIMRSRYLWKSRASRSQS